MDRNTMVLGAMSGRIFNNGAVHPRIARQRTELVLSQPFFGALALRLAVREDPSAKTFWVDGETMGYNPAYLESLSDLEVRGVVAHEVLHVANGHCWRQGARDPNRWNDACDYAINPIVVSAGMVLPKGALIDPALYGEVGRGDLRVAHAGGQAEAAATATASAATSIATAIAIATAPDPQPDPQGPQQPNPPINRRSQTGRRMGRRLRSPARSRPRIRGPLVKSDPIRARTNR